jgi:lipopolysaccharide/colanic/teichoic acid biosynthesis glycosyltransferase
MALFVPVSRANFAHRIELYDVICVCAAPWLAFALRDPRFLHPALLHQGIMYWGISLIAAVIILYSSGIGSIICKYFSAADCKRIILVAFISVSIASTVAFTVTRLDTIPRSLPIIQFFLLGLLLIVGRLVRGGTTQREPAGAVGSKRDENIIIVGANHIATFYIRLIEKCGLGHQRVLAIVDPNPRLRNQTLAGHRIIGAPEDLPVILREYKIHGMEIRKLVVTIDESQLSETARQCLCSDDIAGQAIDLEFLPERLGFRTREASSSADVVGDSYSDRTANAARNKGYWRVKRGIDIIVASCLLVCLSPTLILTAAMVRVAIGSPVIFWQRRIGRLGAGIFVYKFRTMPAQFDADGHLRERSEGLGVTGALLRRTHIDEFPQLFNILRGDMSLIGPRPLLPIDQPSHNETRLLVRPGITGWAQVNGGGLITREDKNALDEYYVRHASLWLDIKIFLKTIPIFFTGDRLPVQDVRFNLGTRLERI